jgi:GGDEF domain-containing protein
MILGGSELQVFVTFLVILACAFVALLMDYLKGNNEQLRERHVDLLVRQEQYAGKAGVDAAVLARSLEKVLGEQTVALKEIVAESVAHTSLRGLEEARKSGVGTAGYVSSLQDLPVWEIPEPKREAPSAAVGDGEKVKISLVAEEDVKPAAVAPAAALEEKKQEEIGEPAPAAAGDAGAHDFDRFLDDLVSEFEANPSAYPDPQEVLAPETAAVENLGADSAEQLAPLAAALETPALQTPRSETLTKEIPAGVHTAAVLQELLAAPPALQGVVVCVGINEYSDLHKNLGKQAAEQLLGNVDVLMSDMVRGKAFLCRRSEDEFILVEPELSGALAQRRLNEISERLWDFQLRNLGSFSVVFSWGAHEARGESLREAVEAAQEKMRETQAARKSSSFDKLRRRLATA